MNILKINMIFMRYGAILDGKKVFNRRKNTLTILIVFLVLISIIATQ